jgi:hypothetical protein
VRQVQVSDLVFALQVPDGPDEVVVQVQLDQVVACLNAIHILYFIKAKNQSFNVDQQGESFYFLDFVVKQVEVCYVF